jgi:anti-sigma regulatory factor (Ser/Thr protein kinase)
MSPVSVLCAYDGILDHEAVTAAERTHQTVLRGEQSYAGLSRELRLPQSLSRPPESALKFTFRGDQAGVRRFAATQARRAGLPPNRVTDLVIAVGELAGNTLVHTSGPGTLTMWRTDSELLCQVSDTGWIDDPLVGTLRPEPTALTSRRGLWLVHQVADLVQTRTGPAGTTTRLHMRLEHQHD